MTFYIFGEGKTEKILVHRLTDDKVANKINLNLPSKPLFIGTGGKYDSVNKISERLEPELSPFQKVRCVILADRDAGDTTESIREKYENGFCKILEESGYKTELSFQFLHGWNNILTLATFPPDLPDLRIALHIAEPPPLPISEDQISDSAATDGYILAAALTKRVLTRFAQKAGMTQEKLLNKITREIPDLMRRNGIERLDSKDFISAYMTAARFLKISRSEDVSTFAEIVISRAIKREPDAFKEIFASTLEAFRCVTA
ncbi:hypothetical protein QUF80_00860 [Desulfococcaceae bacterium HSG8]|nr:hypothetical protein [Desulfococcaceae bacterium HSG8]